MKRFITIIVCFSFKAFALVNGIQANYNQFPFVVEIYNCTATKISPRHFITAAHCYWFQTHKNRDDVFLEVIVGNLKRNGRAKKIYFENVRKINHTSWNAYGQKENKVTKKFNAVNAIDIMIYELAEDDFNIPWIEIDQEVLNIGDQVIMAGYGRTNGIYLGNKKYDNYLSRLIFRSNIISGSKAAYFEKSYFNDYKEDYLDKWIYVLEGYGRDIFLPSLAKGDSGGPLLVKRGESWKIAGIASINTDFSEEWIAGVNIYHRLSEEVLTEIFLTRDEQFSEKE